MMEFVRLLNLILRSVSQELLQKFYFIKNNIKLKPEKIFECSCVDGFTGEFCEFKTEQDHILLIDEINPQVFNSNGKMIDENAVIEDGIDVYRSCSTMLNGEAVIFGGWSSRVQQVL